MEKEIIVSVGNTEIKGSLTLVPDSKVLVIFAHGSGSSRFSIRNKFVANLLNQAHLSTLLFDLLTHEEDTIDQQTRQFRFDIPLLTDRLLLVTRWAQNNDETAHLKIAYFGSSTGAAASLIAAAKIPDEISAVVSRGGRVDLAEKFLEQVECPTLLVVGGLDHEVLELNRQAYTTLNCEKDLAIVPNATHLFEEDDALEKVAFLAKDWFIKHG